jgi:putative ABC transport system permease protein
LLGLIGGLFGVMTAFILTFSMNQIPMFGDALDPIWKVGTFARASLVSLCLGLLGGLYPAWRATRLQPVEALRYE